MFLNFFCFLLVGYDKRRASKKLYRIPEKVFFLLALIGGAIGLYLGMITYRHKTRKPVFTWVILFLLALNLTGFYLFINLPK